jgi:hypothetical protein
MAQRIRTTLVALTFLLLLPQPVLGQYGHGVYAIIVDDEGGFTVSGQGLHTWGFAADTLDAVGFLGGGFTVRYDRSGNYIWKTGEGVHSMSGGMALLPDGMLVVAPLEDIRNNTSQAVRRMDLVSLDGGVVRQWSMDTFSEVDLAAGDHGICSSRDRRHSIDRPYTNLVHQSLDGGPTTQIRFEHPDFLGSSPVSPVASLSAGCALARVYRDSLEISAPGWASVIRAPEDSPRQWLVARTSLDGQLVDTTILPEGIFYLYDMESDAEDNLYVVGSYTEDGMVASTIEGEVILDDGFENNGFLAKLSADGTLAWVRNLDDRLQDSALGIAIDDEGNVVVVGYANSQSHPWTGRASGVVKKYASDGQLVWSREIIPSAQGTVYVRGVDTGPEGEIVVGGTMQNGGIDQTSGTPISGHYAFIVRYDADGTLNWARGAQRVVHTEPSDELPNTLISGNPWPNPVQNTVHLRARTGWETGGEAVVYDLIGREVDRIEVASVSPEGIIRINADRLTPGVYVMRLVNRKGETTRLFVKQ